MKEFLDDYGPVILIAWAMVLVTALIGSFVFMVVYSALGM